MRPSLSGLRGGCPLPTTSTTRLTTTTSRRPFSCSASLSARLIRRPRRPYTFTQLIQLSDGSTYTARTTSPQPLYRSTKDTRNHVMWQPTEKSLRGVEHDEAGRLAAFRGRYGRGFDIQGEGEGEEGSAEAGGAEKRAAEEEADLGDLISGYASPAEGGAEKKK